MLELGTAVRAKRWVSSRQVHERFLPGLESRDVQSGFFGARAAEGFARPLQLFVSCGRVESVVSNPVFLRQRLTLRAVSVAAYERAPRR